MTQTARALARAYDVLKSTDSKTATVYLAPDRTVRLTRIGKSRRSARLYCNLTIGRPNFAARRFVKLAKRAGEPFPIKKVQLR